MKTQLLLITIFLCSFANACDRDGSSGTTFRCPHTGLYFCDDFENGSLRKWDNIISNKGLSAPGTFDILDEGDRKSMRFTAGTRGPNLSDGELILVKPWAFRRVPSADYFVEYRIRPRANSNTGNKYLYAMGRYQGPLQWYFGGLNMQSSSSSTQIEAGFASTSDGGASGSISRKAQQKKPIILDTSGDTDGTWYTVRFDMIGSTVTVYLNGEELRTFTDENNQYSTPGLIGFFTYNRSFEVDYVKVGNPAIKPIQLTLDYTDPTWTAAAGDPALEVTVTAIQDDGTTVDTFTVESSDPSVVSVSQSGSLVTLTPLAEGNANITFMSASDSSIVREIEADITPAFIMPTQTYGDISNQVSPALFATNTHIDTRLTITFDSPPTLGSAGSVRIYRSNDGAEVDVIHLHNEVDSLGFTGQSNVRTLNVNAISVSGNTLSIAPHNNALDYGTQYYVAIESGVVTNVQLNQMDLVGLGETSDWSFTTALNAPSGSTITVDDDADADFRTVQGALNYTMENFATDEPVTISVKNGVYNEALYLRNKNNVTLSGESQSNTIIQYENFEGLNSGTGKSGALGDAPAGGRSLFLIEGADMLTLENLTLKNTHIRSGSGDQAETIYFNSSERLIAKNASFISEQDTLLLKGYNWFYNSLVAGNVDFIWGYSTVSLFENSEIRSLGDSKAGGEGSGGYILQARTQNSDDLGFVFLNSTLTHGQGPLGNDIPDGTTYLARSGGNTNYYDNIAFVNCKMDTHIATVGWASEGVNNQPASNPVSPTAANGWREYASTDLSGNLLNLSERVGGYELSDSEAAAFSDRDSIFSSYNNGEGWNPTP